MIKVNRLELIGYLMFFLGFLSVMLLIYFGHQFYSASTKIPIGAHIVVYNNHGEFVYITEKQNRIIQLFSFIIPVFFVATPFFWLKSGNYKLSLKGDRPMIYRKSEEDL